MNFRNFSNFPSITLQNCLLFDVNLRYLTNYLFTPISYHFRKKPFDCGLISLIALLANSSMSLKDILIILIIFIFLTFAIPSVLAVSCKNLCKNLKGLCYLNYFFLLFLFFIYFQKIFQYLFLLSIFDKHGLPRYSEYLLVTQCVMVIKKIASTECLVVHYQIIYLRLCFIAVKCMSNVQGTKSKKKDSKYRETLEAVKIISCFVIKTSISTQNYIQCNIQTFKGFT